MKNVAARSVSARPLSILLAGGLIFLAVSASAQSLTIYDDALQNSYQNYSYGDGVDMASTAMPRTGTNSIAFTGNAYNAVGFFYPGSNLTTAGYPTLRFWVRAAVTGGQQLRLFIAADGTYAPSAPLDSYISGGSVSAAEWREVTVNLGQAPFNAAAFDRIDIQSDSAGTQPLMYIDDVTIGPAPAVATAPLLIERNVTVREMVTDRFTWRDAAGLPRTAVLAHNDGQTGPAGSRGGALREYRYQLPNGATRIAGPTGYGVGDAGFGYVVSHARTGGCGADDSPIGGFQPGNGFERVFEGRHHAVFRFRQNYPRNCTATGLLSPRTLPVTIDWVFRTGGDHPLWAITYDFEGASPATPANTLDDDSRAPYGELAIDGEGFTAIDGVAWGDRYRFTSLGAPVTLDSAWEWNTANSVPFVKEWLNGPLTASNTRDATMGIVQTQPIGQQDAGGGRNAGITAWWNTTSAAAGNACVARRMPCANDWPYQANANSLDFAYPNGSNNARMTWKTQYGFLGQSSYAVQDGVVATAPGYPKKSYSTYIVLGTHSGSPVEAQVAQVEAVQNATLTASVGSVATSGAAGIGRGDTVTYIPPGYDHVYGAFTFVAAGNRLDANIAGGAGTLRNPLLIVRNYTGGEPQIRIDGLTAAADTDYFASLRPSAAELWITLNRSLAGAVNRVEINRPAADAPSDVRRGDVTGDGKADIFWRNEANGANVVYVMDGSNITTIVLVNFEVDRNYKIVGKGDFDGDGMWDILWRNQVNGANVIYFMNGTTIREIALVNFEVDPNYKIVGVGDFNGDGYSDILWRNFANGANVVYLMNGASISTIALVNFEVDMNYKVGGIGDFNGDGRSDIWWRNSSHGANVIYTMNGSQVVAIALVNFERDMNWKIEGFADFDGDGRADVLWRNSISGANVIYAMNGTSISSSTLVNFEPDMNWKVAQLSDFGGDGRADILWRNGSSGANATYMMNGSEITASALVNFEPDQNWKIVP